VVAYDLPVRIPDRLRVPPSAVQHLALASVAANVLLVVTGGAVRLTGSGLGCPTWPKCTDGSYHNTPAYGIHGYVEFGNRLLGVAIGILVTLVFLAAVLSRDRRRSIIVLSLLNGASIPAQAVVGGLTVLTKLNPWVVAAHFLLSPAIIVVGFLLWRRTRLGDGPARTVVPGPLRALSWLIAGVTVAVLAAGTVVTGSGPHAGDQHAKRTGLDPAMVAQLHADLVCLLIGLSVALWFAVRLLRSTGQADPAAAGLLTRAGWLIVIELAQGVVGFVQYFTHLPDLLVGLHMAGAAAVWLAALSVLFATRTRDPLPAVTRG
jgi:heme a synthase